MAAPGFFTDQASAEAAVKRHQELMWEVGDLMNQWEALEQERRSRPPHPDRPPRARTPRQLRIKCLNLLNAEPINPWCWMWTGVCVCLIVAASVRPTMPAGAIIDSVGVGLVGVPLSPQPVAPTRHTPAGNNLAARSSIMGLPHAAG